ncbi:hypothetical protein [Paraferrimonas sp. SM1919]|uniref:hypothetical protein n=1 Tax=Paraferrimonas sp. SM1919 TaxID=2662263 RepID=UPI0013D7E72E|nr:hypothetical protein [Paraferrimonas sp. SM1919]
MRELYDKFISLDAEAKKKAHIKACGYSLAAWDSFVQKGKGLSYRDSVVLMKHHIDQSLPSGALQAVIDGEAKKEISEKYLEPIAALQDMDWEPPEHIEYAFYSIYNLYRKYCEASDIDDWLIINQCLSSETNEEKWNAIFKSILS